MLYHCQAVVVAPGGVGTLDELFEVMTLRQTYKIQADMPIVLFGTEYWNTIVNWQALVKYGVVNPSDVELLFITDSGAVRNCSAFPECPLFLISAPIHDNP